MTNVFELGIPIKNQRKSHETFFKINWFNLAIFGLKFPSKQFGSNWRDNIDI